MWDDPSPFGSDWIKLINFATTISTFSNKLERYEYSLINLHFKYYFKRIEKNSLHFDNKQSVMNLYEKWKMETKKFVLAWTLISIYNKERQDPLFYNETIHSSITVFLQIGNNSSGYLYIYIYTLDGIGSSSLYSFSCKFESRGLQISPHRNIGALRITQFTDW